MRRFISWAPCLAALVLAGWAALTGPSAPAQEPSSPVIQITGVRISPQAPPVGTYYTVTATIYNRYGGTLTVLGGIQVPEGDIVTSPLAPETQVAGGGYGTLTWTCYCGVDGGLVRVYADAVR